MFFVFKHFKGNVSNQRCTRGVRGEGWRVNIGQPPRKISKHLLIKRHKTQNRGFPLLAIFS
jgi:hypothetical protein